MSPVRLCPLCVSTKTTFHARTHGRTYFTCATCGLIFMERTARPGELEEKTRYETHQNDPADEAYRTFLARLADPIARVVPAAASGLDYGSGPGPTLHLMLEERGYEMAIYDPFFAPDASVLDRTYDFITCSETAEHFFDPRAEFDRLASLIRPGGWLGVMTQFPGDHEFETWSYARDETHVCFYRERTMTWIATHFGWALHFPRPSVALFQSG